ncbi:MAG: transposase, partial [Thermoplasmata archaeon]
MSQVIVMAAVTLENPDNQHLRPMIEELERELGGLPRKLLADAGYFSEAQIRGAEAKGVEVYCPPEPWRVAETAPCPRGRPPLNERFTGLMRRKLRSVRGRAEYRWRKVRGEWFLGCLAHNLRKIHRARVG